MDIKESTAKDAGSCCFCDDSPRKNVLVLTHRTYQTRMCKNCFNQLRLAVTGKFRCSSCHKELYASDNDGDSVCKSCTCDRRYEGITDQDWEDLIKEATSRGITLEEAKYALLEQEQNRLSEAMERADFNASAQGMYSDIVYLRTEIDDTHPIAEELDVVIKRYAEQWGDVGD